MHLGMDISGITCDSRRVKPGFAFTAIKGEKEDGNDYIQEAISKGASVIYTECSPKQLPLNTPIIRVQDARKTLAEMSANFYGFPSKKLNVIGITGTNGKTTTSFMTELIFRQAGYCTGLIGTVMIKAGNKYYTHGLTTPDSEYIQKYLNEMVNEGVCTAIMEVSSHGLKYQRVDAVEFNVAVHTNITMDHIDTHNDFDEYIFTKKRLFNMMLPGSVALINADDTNGLELVKDNPGLLILTYGLGAKASITASSIDLNGFGINYTCCLQRSFTNFLGDDVEPQEIPVSLAIPGKHNVYNSLAAATVGLLYGIEPCIIQKALKGFKGVWRRMQTVYCKDYIVIDDFSHNPGSYEAAFETVQTMDYNDLYIINAIRGGRGKEINKANAAVIASWANLLDTKEIFATSSKDAVGSQDCVTEDERESFMTELERTGVKVKHYPLLRSAIEDAVNKVKKGDIILLMGAQGMDKGQDIFYSKTGYRCNPVKQDALFLSP